MADVSPGALAFIAGAAECGIDAVAGDDVVTLAVTPITGSHAGLPMQVGVALDELTGWPAVPPHWIHMPEDITFEHTNAQQSTVAGWKKHSRGTPGWGNAEHPAQAYLSHLRSVLGEAA
jgi:hypothetical protein